MTRRPATADDFDPPAGCRPTADRVNALLDGGRPVLPLLADPHVTGCGDCRDLVRSAALLADVLANRPEPVTPPPELAGRVTAAVLFDHRRRKRLRLAGRVGVGLAVAACLAVAVGTWWKPAPQELVLNTPDPAPVPRLDPTPAPKVAPAPVRLDTQLAEAEDAWRSLTAQAARPPAPPMFAPLADVFAANTMPTLPEGLEPVAHSLAELPDAARSGLSPVTGTTYRAFSRLLSDVSGVQPTAAPKPKS